MSRIVLEPPDIVITDYLMPEKTEDFVPWIKYRHPEIPVIVMSGLPEEAVQAMPDADVVLGKPISLGKILQTVLRFVTLIEVRRLGTGAPN